MPVTNITPTAHRHPDPEDRRAFAPERAAGLQTAVADLAWLLGRGYGRASAAHFVGEGRHLLARERQALLRLACADAERDDRQRRFTTTLQGRALVVDGFNVLVTVEAGLGGAVVLAARDGATRDLASATRWHPVAETAPALGLVCAALVERQAGPIEVLLDEKVQNGGRLAAGWLEAAAAVGLSLSVRRLPAVDGALVDSAQLVASADSAVLDRGVAWCDLPGLVLRAVTAPVWWVRAS